MSQLSLFGLPGETPVPETSIVVLGIKFQGFKDPATKQIVFSQSGVARALEVDERTVRRYLSSQGFKRWRGGSSPRGTLLTEVSTKPISVVTQADLVILVKLAAERGNPIASSMQDASFAVLLQQSVDQALGIHRPLKEYLAQGASLRQRVDYLQTYHSMKDATFECGHGVGGLCLINAQVSSLAVPDAEERRKENPCWRNLCSRNETMRLTIGSAVAQRAAEASPGREALKGNISKAKTRITDIYNILDAPF